MRIKPVTGEPNYGKLIVNYSETGVGKTTSCFSTLPTPILMMVAEQRNAQLSALACGRQLKMGGSLEQPEDYVIAEYTTWDEFMVFIEDTKKFAKFRSIVLDGLTQLMHNLSTEIEKASWDALPPDKKKKKLIQEAKMSVEGYGALASQMNRAVPCLGKLTQEGKFVIINALIDSEDQKWNSTTKAYPSLMGKKFGNDLPGACDLIGMSVRQYDKAGAIVFPPLIKFESDEGENFECKWTGPRLVAKDDNGKVIPNAPMQMPLDYNIILGLNEKKGGNTNNK